mgnify:CR=1 FL=1
MHTRSFTIVHPRFAAQAEIEENTSGRNKTAWRQASEKGFNLLVKVGWLSCICMLLMGIYDPDIDITDKCRLQRSRKFSGKNAEQECHQRQEAQQTAATVSANSSYNKCNFFSKAKWHINMHAQHEGSFVQREIFERSAKRNEKASQKPSQVCGENQLHGSIKSVQLIGMLRGLITLQANQQRNWEKCYQKIHRLIKEFQQKRQAQLGLQLNKEAGVNRQWQNIQHQPHGIKPSIENLFEVSSTSESSSYEFDAELADGVHTGNNDNAVRLNGRNARMESRSDLLSKQKKNNDVVSESDRKGMEQSLPEEHDLPP